MGIELFHLYIQKLEFETNITLHFLQMRNCCRTKIAIICEYPISMAYPSYLYMTKSEYPSVLSRYPSHPCANASDPDIKRHLPLANLVLFDIPKLPPPLSSFKVPAFRPTVVPFPSFTFPHPFYKPLSASKPPHRDLHSPTASSEVVVLLCRGRRFDQH